MEGKTLTLSTLISKDEIIRKHYFDDRAWKVSNPEHYILGQAFGKIHIPHASIPIRVILEAEYISPQLKQYIISDLDPALWEEKAGHLTKAELYAEQWAKDLIEWMEANERK